MKPTFIKKYQLNNKGSKTILSKAPSAVESKIDEKSVEATHTPEQLRHLHACIHFTHEVMSVERQRRLDLQLPKLSDFE